MKKERYIGSVRYYKNLILLAVLLLIGTGVFFSVYFGTRYLDLKQQVDSVSSYTFSVDSQEIAYQEMYPDFYAPQSYNAVYRDSGVMYLTFEGGSDTCTRDILAILGETDTKATFFVNGNISTSVLQEIVQQGHALGMLSFSSDYSTIYSSVESYLQDMSQLYDYIVDATGSKPTLFRFLGGSINGYNAGFYQELLGEMVRRGFVPFDWNLSVQDSPNNSFYAEDMVAYLSSEIVSVDRGIVQIHNYDGNDQMLEALPRMIEILNEANYDIDILTPSTKPVLFAYSN